MAVKVIIFDFDGTIADTLDALVRIANRLAPEFGYQPLSHEVLVEIKNLNSRQAIKQAGISLVKLPFLLKRVQAELSKEIQVIKPILGISSVLKELKQQGYKLGIITSNTKENVVAFLQKNGLQELFDFIYSARMLFGKSKIINRVLKQEKIECSEVIYVGDETRDIEAARKTCIKVISVSWGFNSKALLARHLPDSLIEKPQDLFKAIASLN